MVTFEIWNKEVQLVSMTASYQHEMRELWERYHDKDVKETNFDWQSWSLKKEQSTIEENNNK